MNQGQDINKLKENYFNYDTYSIAWTKVCQRVAMTHINFWPLTYFE